MDAWKLWMIAGVVLAILEILVLPAQFLLVALGLCAVLVGVLAWSTDIGTMAQLAWFGALAVVLVPGFVVTWRRKMPVRYPGTAAEVGQAPQVAEVIETDPLTVRLLGDRFPARAAGDEHFEIGEQVCVVRFSGITATITRKND
jgi:membrane protein implicated in regulation of membrane protease activity